MKKGKVIAGLIGAAIVGGAGALYMTDNIPDSVKRNIPGLSSEQDQSKKVEDVNAHNARIAQTPRENMVIECSNQIEFTNSFAEMKSKMPEQDQKALDQALNAVIKRKGLSQTDIDENLCNEFKGWNEKRFLEEAAK